jgi:glycosyltransferase involved in cell wall biosynthesis
VIIFLKNIKSVFVQTENYRKSVKQELKVDSELMPFFEDLSKYAVKSKKKTYDFAYISLPNPNKNFELFFDTLNLLNHRLTNEIKIVLTIPKEEIKLIEKIKEFKNTNINIINMGKLSMKHVVDVLNKTKTLVFPSLHETFGLPLVEACQLKMFVISSDLPYVYDVINPSLTFDPFSKNDIANKMHIALDQELKSPEIIIKNKINKLIKTLSNHEL